MTKIGTFDESDLNLFEGGPLHSLLVRARIARPGSADVALKIAALFALTWIPLIVLAFIQGVAINPGLKMPLLHDFFLAIRFFVVGPLLIVAEAIVGPWLIHTVREFGDSLVPEAEIPKYRGFVARARRWRDSYLAEILLSVCALGAQFWRTTYSLSPAVGTWLTYVTAGTQEPSMASIWDFYVASPLIRFLWLRWMWKYLIWSLFLCRVAALHLKLVPTHPDRAGGLGFVASGHVKLAILSVAFSAQVASYIGEQILFLGLRLDSFRDEIVATAILNLLIFLTPLLAFSPKLIACKRDGLFEYTKLADRYVTDFHEKWIAGIGSQNEPLLGSPDVQSLADVGSSFERVEKMKAILISRETALTFLVASLVPFSPLLLSRYPIDKLLLHLFQTFL